MIEIFAPAKINLHLHVTGKRADGYHLLDSLVCFADIGDKLSVKPADDFKFFVNGEFADTVPKDMNTVIKAANLLSSAFQKPLHVEIHLIKNLPAGAGLGGGSADGAACIKGLAQLWNLDLNDARIQEIALQVGSDVPVCLHSKPVIMQGIGEEFIPAPALPEIYAVLIWPNQHVSTPAVFKTLMLENFSASVDFKSSTLLDNLKATRNDLSKAAEKLYPIIADALDALKTSKDCQFARMSGSGSSVFGFFADKNKAADAAQKIAAAHPDWWVRSCRINKTN